MTVKSGDKLKTFAVDSKTAILGTGLGTITKKFKDEGKLSTIIDLLTVNDQVVVGYKDEAGTKRAHEIRVTQRRRRRRGACPVRAPVPVDFVCRCGRRASGHSGRACVRRC